MWDGTDIEDKWNVWKEQHNSRIGIHLDRKILHGRCCERQDEKGIGYREVREPQSAASGDPGDFVMCKIGKHPPAAKAYRHLHECEERLPWSGANPFIHLPQLHCKSLPCSQIALPHRLLHLCLNRQCQLGHGLHLRCVVGHNGDHGCADCTGDDAGDEYGAPELEAAEDVDVFENELHDAADSPAKVDAIVVLQEANVVVCHGAEQFG